MLLDYNATHRLWLMGSVVQDHLEHIRLHWVQLETPSARKGQDSRRKVRRGHDGKQSSTGLEVLLEVFVLSLVVSSL